MPGNVTQIAASSEPMSIPSSSAFVATTPSSSPSSSLRSSSRRCWERVAGAVGRDPLRQLAAPAILEPELREPRHQLHRLARLHEHDRPRALAHEVGEQVGRLGEHRAARADLLVRDRRVPHRDRALGRGRAVAVDDRDVVEPGQPLGQLAGFATVAEASRIRGAVP